MTHEVTSFLAALIAVTLLPALSSDTAFALYPDRIVRIVATVAEAGVPARWRKVIEDAGIKIE